MWTSLGTMMGLHPEALHRVRQQVPAPRIPPSASSWRPRRVVHGSSDAAAPHAACAPATRGAHACAVAAEREAPAPAAAHPAERGAFGITATERGAATSSSSSTQAGPSGAPAPPSAGPGGEGDGGDGGNDFNINFGEAVVCLREDLPEMFERDMRWHIYREDITLTLGTINGARLHGMEKYKWLHRSVRALTWLLYSDVRLTTLRMWESQTERRQLRVRWCVLARPRLPSFLAGSEPMRFEAISTYKFDSRTGRIYEHSVDRLIPPESPVAKWIESFIHWHGIPAAQQQPGGIPVPGGGGGSWREQL